MKKLFFMFVAAGLTLTAAAQGTEKQMATLQHGDQTSVFYGPDAFVSAYNAAADTLDVITLSSGEFSVPSSISKSIAIYGAGFETDMVTGTPRTYLNRNITLIPADSQDSDGNTIIAGQRVNGVHIEGVSISGQIQIRSNNGKPIHNLSIVKCRFSHITVYVDLYDCVIRQSYMTGFPCGDRVVKASNFLISNNYIQGDLVGSAGFYLSFSDTSTILFDHCILWNNKVSGPFRYTNNIINGWSLSSTAEGSNNIFISNSGNSTTTTLDGSWYNMRNQAVWAAEDTDASYAEDKDFELKYPERYVGTDGTEIGLHGGIYAWNKIPSIPRITECVIDTENVTDGILKVSIKAEAQTKE